MAATFRLRLAGAHALALALIAGFALFLPGCDNPACVFGGDCSNQGNTGVGGNPATIPTDGTWIDSAAPTVTAMFPTGTGVDRNAPVVIVFSESMSPSNLNIAFELVAGGAAGGALPFGVTSLVGDGRVLVLMPLTPLLPSTLFTVRYRMGVNFQDLTGQVITQPADRVVGSFTTAASDAPAPVLLTTWPPDNASDQSATGEIVAIFSRQVTPASVTDTSFAVTVNGTPPAFDPVAQPLSVGGGLATDTRVYRYRSVNTAGVPVPFPPSAALRIDLSPAANPIEDTGGNDLAPATFDFHVAAFGAPLTATITSMPSDAIGIDQLSGPADLAVQVGSPDAQSGDQLLVSIFGTKVTTDMNPPLIALQRTITLSAPFTTFTLTATDLDLVSGTSPLTGRVADGSVGLALQLKRGARITPVRMLDVDLTEDGVQSPQLDTVAPTLVGLGTSGTAVGVFRSDLRDLAIVGRASEPLRSALVTTPANGDNDFAMDGFPPVAGAHRSGLFVAAPVPLGLLPALQPVNFSITIFDRALNSGGTASGSFRQLGASGPGAALPGGTISVEVFDETTLAPISAATVFTHEDLAGVVTSVGSASTLADGSAMLPAATTGATILTVFATGYELFTFDGVPTDHLSIPLRPSALSNAGTDGVVATVEPTFNLFTKSFADSRTLFSADRLAPVSSCSFDNTQSRFECPYGPTTVRAREIGAQSTLAVQPPTSLFLFSPLSFLHGFQLVLPLPPVDPGATQGGELVVDSLLSAPSTDPEERAIDGPPLALSTINYPMMVGGVRVTVEAIAAGMRGTAVVGSGVAFDLAPPSTTFGVREAYPGAVDGIPDIMSDVLGRFVRSHTIQPDLMVRVELIESTGTRGGARPRLSTNPLAVTPPRPSALDVVVPIALNASGEMLDLTFDDVLPDAIGEPGIYRVTLTDLAGRSWRVWKSDADDASGPFAVVHLPLIGPGPSFPLAPGTLTCRISAFAWPGLDTSNLLWTDVEREFELFSHSASEPVTPP